MAYSKFIGLMMGPLLQSKNREHADMGDRVIRGLL